MTNRARRTKVDLRQLFMDMQDELLTTLSRTRRSIRHPGAKGNVTEEHWRTLLQGVLPERYQVSKAFVVDSRGDISDEIDILIYDRQYSPLVLRNGSTSYVPAESVYCAIEVKPVIDAKTIRYAGAKAASVRRLHRTSAAITHAGGTYSPRKPFEIIAGLVALDCGWAKIDALSITRVTKDLKKQHRLDFGCAIKRASFWIDPSSRLTRIHVSPEDVALMSFLMTLLSRLQAVGTVPAIDWREYARVFES